MPNIVEYNSPTRGLQPSEVGVEAVAQEGRRIGSIYHEEGATVGGAIAEVGGQFAKQAEDYEDQHLRSQGMVTAGKLNNTIGEQWDNLAKTSDPNDRSISQGYMEKQVQPSWQNWLKGFDSAPRQTKEWAMNYADAHIQHQQMKMDADMVTRAGAAAHQNAVQTISSSIADVSRDPSNVNLSFAHQKLDMDIDTMLKTSNTSPDQAAQIKDELGQVGHQKLNEAAFSSKIQADPQQFLKDLDNGQLNQYDKYGLDEGKLRKEASEAIRAQGSDQERILRDQERQKKMASDDRASQYVQALTPGPDGNPRIGRQAWASQVLADKTLEPGAAHQMIEDYAAVQKFTTEPTTDPETFYGFTQRMGLPPTDPQALKAPEIYSAFAARRLSPQDKDTLISNSDAIAKDPERRQAQAQLNRDLASLKPLITNAGANGLVLPQQNDRFGQFQRDVQQRFDAGRAAGIPVTDLLDRNSKNYVARDAQRYVIPTGQQSDLYQQNMTSGPTLLPPVVPDEQKWKQGDSAEDVLKRLNGAQ